MFDVIELKDVSFQYDQTPILKKISLKIRAGEFINIIGPNGGGKTTLLNLLMGFIPPTSGVVKVLGKSPSTALSEIGYVPQLFAFDKLFPISVFEVVISGRLSRLPWHGYYRKEDKRLALEAIEQVGLLSFKDKPLGELSGGQVQRTLIARALVTNPKILLLDEPTSCIDFSAQMEIDKILKELKRKLTIITVTHDLDHIGSETDRVLCIHGHLSELKPKDVCQHFSMGLYSQPTLEKELEVR